MKRRRAPLQKPVIAKIRDLRIPPASTWSFLIRKGSDWRLQDEAKGAVITPQSVPVIELPAGQIASAKTVELLKQLPSSQEQAHRNDLYAEVILKGWLFRAAGSSSSAQPLGEGENTVTPEAKDVPASLAALLSPSIELDMISPFVGGLKLRPYQQEARRALLEARSLLLADDPGTGKVVTAASALSFLIQEGKAKRALVVCSENRLQHWEKQFTTWGPGLVVNSVRSFKGHTSHAWSDPSQVILMDYEQLAADLNKGSIDESELAFDVLILADILAVPRQTDRIFAPLKKVSATWRWGLSGSIPQSSQEWVRLFEILIPEPKHEELKHQLSDPSQRYLPFVMRRERTEIAREMPSWNRQELWLDLLDAQRDHYFSVLAEERDRLMRMGSRTTSKEINQALSRLCQTTNTLGDSFDGPKVRALLEQVGAIAASGGKVVVFCHDQHGEMDNLITVLESFRTVRLDADASLEERSKVLEAMRHEPSVRVLLAHVDAKTDGLHLEGTSYIIHFDAGLNAESSRKAEWTVFPKADPPLPVNVFEFWIAQTHEEQLHALISSRLPGHAKDPFTRQLPEWYQPLTIDDWLTAVLQIGSNGEKALASG